MVSLTGRSLQSSPVTRTPGYRVLFSSSVIDDGQVAKAFCVLCRAELGKVELFAFLFHNPSLEFCWLLCGSGTWTGCIHTRTEQREHVREYL